MNSSSNQSSERKTDSFSPNQVDPPRGVNFAAIERKGLFASRYSRSTLAPQKVESIAELKASIDQLGYLSKFADLNDAINRFGRHVPCPIHGGKDGFRLFNWAGDIRGVCNTCNDGGILDIFDLGVWLTGRSLAEVLRDAREHSYSRHHATNEHLNFAIESVQGSDTAKQSNIERIWSESENLELDGSVDRYLRQRGLPGVSQSILALREHPSLGYYQEGIRLDKFPTMVAMATDLANNHISNHKTHLTSDGCKAGVRSPKKIQSPAVQGSLNGCAVRLFEARRVLGLAEGIETALACHAMTGIPVWACLTAGFLERVLLPASIQEIHIFADKDLSLAGERAARRLGSRLAIEGKTVRLHIPEVGIPPGAKSVDWLDVYAGAE